MTRKLSWLLLLLLTAAVHAVDADGPYVLRGADGKLLARSVQLSAEGAREQAVPTAVGAILTIPAVGRLPAFEVILRGLAANSPDVVAVDAEDPLFVVADTHGEFEILAGMLMRQGVVDRKLQWSFGRGRLVFLGDVFDRGPHQLEILWLIYELEAQASKAGGAVYLTLGNHETMVLRGDLRYLNARYRDTAQLLGVSSYSQLFDAGSVLGQWLRSKPAVLKLGDFLCLHGGISPALVARKLSLTDLNVAVRAELGGREPGGADAARAEFVFGNDGPLWYRGYFPDAAGGVAVTSEDIGRIRAHFGARRILVGHTTVPTITPLFDGQVFAVQVYPRQDSFGNDIFEALLIRDGKFLRALPDGRTEELKF
jgi:hypothetical protein